MILSEKKDKIISSMGWVEKGSLWVLDVNNLSTPSCVKLSDANYLSIHPGKNGHFSIVHNYDSGKLRITVHSFDDLKSVQAEIAFNELGMTTSGNMLLFCNAKCCYAPYLYYHKNADFHLILVDPRSCNVEVQELQWFNEDNYDRGYQGIVSVTQHPFDQSLIFSVQRSSELVVYNPITKAKTGKINLADRGGNPEIHYRNHHLVTVDYDTLVELNLKYSYPSKQRLLQEASGGMQQFAGKLFMHDDGKTCSIARPYSGDIVTIDLDKFSVSQYTKTGGQPLEVVVVENQIFARDWHSGELLKGDLSRPQAF